MGSDDLKSLDGCVKEYIDALTGLIEVKKIGKKILTQPMSIIFHASSVLLPRQDSDTDEECVAFRGKEIKDQLAIGTKVFLSAIKVESSMVTMGAVCVWPVDSTLPPGTTPEPLPDAESELETCVLNLENDPPSLVQATFPQFPSASLRGKAIVQTVQDDEFGFVELYGVSKGNIFKFLALFHKSQIWLKDHRHILEDEETSQLPLGSIVEVGQEVCIAARSIITTTGSSLQQSLVELQAVVISLDPEEIPNTAPRPTVLENGTGSFGMGPSSTFYYFQRDLYKTLNSELGRYLVKHNKRFPDLDPNIFDARFLDRESRQNEVRFPSRPQEPGGNLPPAYDMMVNPLFENQRGRILSQPVNPMFEPIGSLSPVNPIFERQQRFEDAQPVNPMYAWHRSDSYPESRQDYDSDLTRRPYNTRPGSGSRFHENTERPWETYPYDHQGSRSTHLRQNYEGPRTQGRHGSSFYEGHNEYQVEDYPSQDTPSSSLFTRREEHNRPFADRSDPLPIVNPIFTSHVEDRRRSSNEDQEYRRQSESRSSGRYSRETVDHSNRFAPNQFSSEKPSPAEARTSNFVSPQKVEQILNPFYIPLPSTTDHNKTPTTPSEPIWPEQPLSPDHNKIPIPRSEPKLHPLTTDHSKIPTTPNEPRLPERPWHPSIVDHSKIPTTPTEPKLTERPWHPSIVDHSKIPTTPSEPKLTERPWHPSIVDHSKTSADPSEVSHPDQSWHSRTQNSESRLESQSTESIRTPSSTSVDAIKPYFETKIPPPPKEFSAKDSSSKSKPTPKRTPKVDDGMLSWLSAQAAKERNAVTKSGISECQAPAQTKTDAKETLEHDSSPNPEEPLDTVQQSLSTNPETLEQMQNCEINLPLDQQIISEPKPPEPDQEAALQSPEKPREPSKSEMDTDHARTNMDPCLPRTVEASQAPPMPDVSGKESSDRELAHMQALYEALSKQAASQNVPKQTPLILRLGLGKQTTTEQTKATIQQLPEQPKTTTQQLPEQLKTTEQPIIKPPPRVAPQKPKVTNKIAPVLTLETIEEILDENWKHTERCSLEDIEIIPNENHPVLTEIENCGFGGIAVFKTSPISIAFCSPTGSVAFFTKTAEAEFPHVKRLLDDPSITFVQNNALSLGKQLNSVGFKVLAPVDLGYLNHFWNPKAEWLNEWITASGKLQDMSYSSVYEKRTLEIVVQETRTPILGLFSIIRKWNKKTKRFGGSDNIYPLIQQMLFSCLGQKPNGSSELCEPDWDNKPPHLPSVNKSHNLHNLAKLLLLTDTSTYVTLDKNYSLRKEWIPSEEFSRPSLALKIWSQNSLPDETTMAHSADTINSIHSCIKFCLTCGKQSHEECLKKKQQCLYPLCHNKVKHQTLTCPSLHNRCEECGRRGHLPSHHSLYMPTDLDYLFLNWSPLGLFTCIVFLEETDMSSRVQNHHWVSQLRCLGRKASKREISIYGMDVVMGFRVSNEEKKIANTRSPLDDSKNLKGSYLEDHLGYLPMHKKERKQSSSSSNSQSDSRKSHSRTPSPKEQRTTRKSWSNLPSNDQERSKESLSKRQSSQEGSTGDIRNYQLKDDWRSTSPKKPTPSRKSRSRSSSLDINRSKKEFDSTHQVKPDLRTAATVEQRTARISHPSSSEDDERTKRQRSKSDQQVKTKKLLTERDVSKEDSDYRSSYNPSSKLPKSKKYRKRTEGSSSGSDSSKEFFSVKSSHQSKSPLSNKQRKTERSSSQRDESKMSPSRRGRSPRSKSPMSKKDTKSSRLSSERNKSKESASRKGRSKSPMSMKHRKRERSSNRNESKDSPFRKRSRSKSPMKKTGRKIEKLTSKQEESSSRNSSNSRADSKSKFSLSKKNQNPNRVSTESQTPKGESVHRKSRRDSRSKSPMSKRDKKSKRSSTERSRSKESKGYPIKNCRTSQDSRSKSPMKKKDKKLMIRSTERSRSKESKGYPIKTPRTSQDSRSKSPMSKKERKTKKNSTESYTSKSSNWRTNQDTRSISPTKKERKGVRSKEELPIKSSFKRQRDRSSSSSSSSDGKKKTSKKSKLVSSPPNKKKQRSTKKSFSSKRHRHSSTSSSDSSSSSTSSSSSSSSDESDKAKTVSSKKKALLKLKGEQRKRTKKHTRSKSRSSSRSTSVKKDNPCKSDQRSEKHSAKDKFKRTTSRDESKRRSSSREESLLPTSPTLNLHSRTFDPATESASTRQRSLSSRSPSLMSPTRPPASKRSKQAANQTYHNTSSLVSEFDSGEYRTSSMSRHGKIQDTPPLDDSGSLTPKRDYKTSLEASKVLTNKVLRSPTPERSSSREWSRNWETRLESDNSMAKASQRAKEVEQKIANSKWIPVLGSPKIQANPKQVDLPVKSASSSSADKHRSRSSGHKKQGMNFASRNLVEYDSSPEKK